VTLVASPEGKTMTRKTASEQRREALARQTPKTEEYAEYLRQKQYDEAKDRADRSGFPVEVELEPTVRLEQARKRLAIENSERVRERPVYGDGSSRSWFHDFARTQIANQSGLFGNEGEAGDILPPALDGGLAEARTRVAEYRDVTSADPGVASFLPTNAPNFIAEEFATALRDRSVLQDVITIRPLPERGSKVDVPRFATGAAAGVQASEAAAPTQTDIDLDTVSASKVTITGRQTLSLQAFSFADESFDRALAADLGAAVGAVLDQQILNGSGSSGQMRGLLNVSGVTSVTKTNASPTATTNYAAIGDLVKQTSDAYGGMVDTLLLAPRRFAWITSKLAFTPDWLRLQPAVAGAMPENLGGGTNEDRVIAIPRREIILHVGQPRFQVYAEVLSGNLQVRVQALLFAALVAGRKPAAIGVLSGTEVAAPTF
jgi:HK97 family phage major capsid protein